MNVNDIGYLDELREKLHLNCKRALSSPMKNNYYPFHTRPSELGGLCLELSEGLRQTKRNITQSIRQYAWQSEVTRNLLGKN